MKKTLLFIIFIGAFLPIHGQYTAIPDANFEARLDALGYDDIPGDNQVPTANISGVTSLVVSNQNIADLSGIEDFTALENLHCYNNQLTVLDVSQNTNLIWLYCDNNQLTVLDVTQNTNLQTLYCYSNQLISLDLGPNTNLTELRCWGNQLTGLDVSQNTGIINLHCASNELTSLDLGPNTNLTELRCYANQLTSLDVTQNTGLDYLSCHHNQLTDLDITQNTALSSLLCWDNQLTSLDVSQNTGLISLSCQGNQLTSIDVTQNITLTYLRCSNNQLTSLDVSQNPDLSLLYCDSNQLAGSLLLNGLNMLTHFDATNNPALLCIQVDNEANANAGSSIYTLWQKDGGTPYSEDCNALLYTPVPDANFEAALAVYDDIPADGQVPTANISGVISLDVSNQNIADLSGIEDFTALEILDCSSNQLMSLNVSQNTNLTDLNCSGNQFSGDLLLDGLPSLSTFDATLNPALVCIQVDDAAAADGGSGIYAGWQKDGAASYSEDCDPLNTPIPDANFEARLDALGYDDIPGDGQVPTANISGLISLDISSQNIADLSGIEDFTALETLWCNDNQLTSLNVTQNTNLENLHCYNNQLSDLDVSLNTSLTDLRCWNNPLLSLDVTQNINLTDLYCSNNQLTSLDVTQNTGLSELYCHNNQLSDLDVTQNTSLVYLSCNDNQLTGLDVTQNISLTELYCSNNQLASLDVTQNTDLLALECQNNQLSGLLLDGLLSLTSIDANANPALACIQVDNETDANAGAGIYAGWSKDGVAAYSEDCSAFPYTLIPDANFEAALDAMGYDNIPGDNQVPTANISGVISLNVSGQNIADLIGIEDFTALEILDCSSNQLISLNVSQNTNLTDLNCSGNQFSGDLLLDGLPSLSTFDATLNPALVCIQVDDAAAADGGSGIYTTWQKDGAASYSEDCDPLNTPIPDANFEAALDALGYDDIPGDNQVPTANISGVIYLNVAGQNIANLSGIEDFTALRTLRCQDNQLTGLDLTQNTNLTDLSCDNNQLMSLDLGQNPNLTYLECDNNQLTSLDLGPNISLKTLRCGNNQLTSLDVTQNTNLVSLICSSNQLSDLDLSQNIDLAHLWCDDNQLTSLDVSQNTAVVWLYCDNNQLTSLNLSPNTSLSHLWCNDNQLTTLDVAQSTYLYNLNCSNNQLTVLNLGPGIRSLWCYNNQLSGSLLVNGLNGLTDFDASGNPGLVCIQVDNATAANAGAGIYATWQKDETATYAENCLNTTLGAYSGNSNTGQDNSFTGAQSGYTNTTGNNNTHLGAGSGFFNQDGSGNLFLGHRAGDHETGSNLLYVANSDTDTPLIQGDFANDLLGINGALSIGNVPMPGAGVDYNLYVENGILTEKLRVSIKGTADWSDHVFENDYKLRPLDGVAAFVTQNKHLPGIPSATEVAKEGIDLAQMDAGLLEKIEELVLYAIEQNKTLKQRQKQLQELRQENGQLLKRIEILESQQK